jgi:hypothetical protein
MAGMSNLVQIACAILLLALWTGGLKLFRRHRATTPGYADRIAY